MGGDQLQIVDANISDSSRRMPILMGGVGVQHQDCAPVRAIQPLRTGQKSEYWSNVDGAPSGAASGNAFSVSGVCSRYHPSRARPT